MVTAVWKHAAASVLGRGHEQTGIPCQDACCVKESADGRWLALVACDGAGSASRSQESAPLVAGEFARHLIAIAHELDAQPPGAWVTDAVIEGVLQLRKSLRRLAGQDNLGDFHCTLVAALIGPAGGFAIHLGDGAVIAGTPRVAGQDTIDLGDAFFVSEPQNGEYANETVFVTERDWIRHLRIQPLAAVSWLLLGTDGGMALAMMGDSRPKTGFILPVLKAMAEGGNSGARESALVAVLTDRQADRLTNDDKTLVVVVRSNCREIRGEFPPPAPAQPLPATSLPPQLPASAPISPSAAAVVAVDTKRPAAKPRCNQRLIALVALLVVTALAAGGWVAWQTWFAKPTAAAAEKTEGKPGPRGTARRHGFLGA